MKNNILGTIFIGIIGIILGLSALCLYVAMIIITNRGWVLWEIWVISLLWSILIVYCISVARKKKMLTICFVASLFSFFISHYGLMPYSGNAIRAKIVGFESAACYYVPLAIKDPNRPIPQDVFSDEGKQLNVKKINNDTLLVWSIGPDKYDDKGEIECNNSLRKASNAPFIYIYKFLENRYYRKAFPGDLICKVNLLKKDELQEEVKGR